MGRRGPKPEPTLTKLLKGNPGKRPVNTEEPVPDGMPIPPKHLNAYARQVWIRILDSMPDGVYTACDTESLAIYCDMCSMYKTASTELKKKKLNPLADGKKVNAWFRIKTEAANQITRIGTTLGLTPSARAAIHTPSKPKKSKFGDLIAHPGSKKKRG